MKMKVYGFGTYCEVSFLKECAGGFGCDVFQEGSLNSKFLR